MNPSSASFRDPAGHVFSNNGKIYRSIFKHGKKDYEMARDEKIYDMLINANLLVPHEEIDLPDFSPDGTIYCLKHSRIPMVSYPWEWSFSMLKSAALVHLNAMEYLVEKGFWLRDANAFNVQYDGERMRLIDTLSIGRRVLNKPWVGYGQFCSHFLAPLALAAYSDIRLLGLWRNYIDGIPLDFASKLLPRLRKIHPRLFLHLTLHARYQKESDKKSDIEKQNVKRKPKVSDRALIGLINSLRNTVRNIKWKRKSKIWQDYDSIRTYTNEDVSIKSEYVKRIVARIKPKMVFDLGGNTGEFSFIAASLGAFVVSIDGDPACTELIYQKLSNKKGGLSILPLTMDLANPSPGLGWNNLERPSLKERGSADLVLALALIHHLVFSNNIPLMMIAEWLSSMTDNLIVEFIPISDPMVRKLLMNRGDEYLPYSEEVFLHSFNKYFKQVEKIGLDNDRYLFFYSKN